MNCYICAHRVDHGEQNGQLCMSCGLGSPHAKWLESDPNVPLECYSAPPLIETIDTMMKRLTEFENTLRCSTNPMDKVSDHKSMHTT